MFPGPTQTGSRSVQPFLQGSLVWQTDRHKDRPTDRPRYSVGNNTPHLRTQHGQCGLIIILTKGSAWIEQGFNPSWATITDRLHNVLSFKIMHGHWYQCHIRLPITLPLEIMSLSCTFTQWPWTHYVCGRDASTVSNHQFQFVHKIWSTLLHPFQICLEAPKFNKKASIRWQDSALPIAGYWPISEPNAG